MPFKSQAQRAKFAEMVSQGKIAQSTFDEWNSDTPNKIPHRVGAKKARVSPYANLKPRTMDELKAAIKKATK